MAGRRETPSILAALADLSSEGDKQPRAPMTIPLDWFRWLPLRALTLFGAAMPSALGTARLGPRLGAELMAADSLPPHSSSLLAQAVDATRQPQAGGDLRVGWLWLAGQKVVGDERIPVFTPLVSRQVAVRSAAGMVEVTSPPIVSSLVTDLQTRQQMVDHVETGNGALADLTVRPSDSGVGAPVRLLSQLPNLRRYALDGARAAGFPTAHLVPAGAPPADLMAAEHVVVVAGVGVWSTKEADGLDQPGGLRTWSQLPAPAIPSAFEQLYLDELDGASDEAGMGNPSPFVLDRAQRDALEAARQLPLSVVSGPPGTGKSHLLVALACDALSRGERVLVAARSDDAADALLQLMERAPGPVPVVFGGSERRHALAARLAGGQLRPVTTVSVDRSRRDLDEAVAERDEVRQAIVSQLTAEADLEHPPPVDEHLAAVAPRLCEPRAPLDEVEALVAELGLLDDQPRQPPHAGLLARHRLHGAEHRLRLLTGAGDNIDLATIAAAARQARAAERQAVLGAAGGPDLAKHWPELEAAEALVRRRAGEWLAQSCRSEKQLNRHTLPAVAALATALRSGRAARRQQLRRIDRALTGALPLWIGSLPDIDDLLPAVPDLFDVVLLDEASSIDQALAAPALLRAPRAIIAGDPRQLRHTASASDEVVAATLDRHGLAGDAVIASKLDVGRNSVWDVAAGAAPVVELDEHHRSVPHLISWVAHRLYDDRLRIATRSPRTATRRAIDVQRVGGHRNDQGVVAAEVAAVRRIVLRLRDRGEPSVGVVSPSSSQVDAIRHTLGEALHEGEAERLDLRLATVQGFQGNERDVVVVSLGVGDGGDEAWAWIEEPHLFAVMASRARQRLEIVTSGTPPAGGLVESWLAQAEAPPVAPASRDDEVSPWARQVATDLRAAGQDATTAYPVGADLVDVVTGDTHRMVALAGGVHPDGPDAHIERHLALLRAGWEVRDAWPSAAGTEDDPVVDLIVSLGQRPRR